MTGVFTALIVLMAGLLAGMTGFGFNLFSAPLLTLLYPPQHVVPVTLILGGVTTLAMMWPHEVRTHINVRMVGTLLMGSICGVPLGVIVLRAVDARFLRAFIIVGTVLYAIGVLLGVAKRVKQERIGALSAGLLSGFMAASTGLSGPPVVLFFASQELAKESFRSTVAAYIILVNVVSLVGLWVGGLLTSSVLREAALYLPVPLLGVVLGMVAFKQFTTPQFHRVVMGCLVGVGMLSMWTMLR